MKSHGAFIQRFTSSTLFDDRRSKERLRAMDDVLMYAKAAALHQGRTFVVMYDLSGMPAHEMGRVIND